MTKNGKKGSLSSHYTKSVFYFKIEFNILSKSTKFQNFSKDFAEELISRHSLNFYKIHKSLARWSNSAREGGFALLLSFFA